ncbi:MAG: hypothetical protein A3D56_02960 [Candidatus Taylorbacteria bacterium RIFCSPHIGHO2_02_FULL_45_35]|uniref:Recombination protein RecR n=1 Tax=Candidatus Taylorbacteria bacterium RIFCSPHIGHO2_02_FULL_45_35 TaxID=1802311 RepID=A0A1G2MPY3_9BACT|nr:MAG: hypothetical protein A3D56_02960 [Candidatus Taylorbacteria bacterium RIFCSPHIGHO2_02_FULL_45_35]
MNSVEKLTDIFSRFPGIGPRQAKRFVYYLLTRDSSTIEEFVRLVRELQDDVVRCKSCFHFFIQNKSKNGLCNICLDGERDSETLMVVSRDVDLESIEKSGLYQGMYFVLGGTVPILEKNPEGKIRVKELQDAVKKRIALGLKEIIVAMNWNPEGENTAEYVTKLLSPIISGLKIKISLLGRGLSTGTELEYSDSETIKNALKNRG